jgi:hypothetical protein
MNKINRTKKLLVALALVGTIFTAGCATVSAWWQSFTQSPATQIESFFQEVQTVLTLLEGAWNLVQPFIPASALTMAQQQYANAIAGVAHAEAALQDALDAAVAAEQSPMPDFTTMMTSVDDALNQVISIVDLYRGGAVDGGPALSSKVDIAALEEARTRVAKLHSFRIASK